MNRRLLTIGGLVVAVIVVCCGALIIAGALLPDDEQPTAEPAKVRETDTPLPATPTESPEPPTVTPEPVNTQEPGLIESESPVVVPESVVPAATATPIPVEQTAPAVDCICSSNVYNCDDAEAQTCFDVCLAAGAGDVHGLDRDGDGRACE